VLADQPHPRGHRGGLLGGDERLDQRRQLGPERTRDDPREQVATGRLGSARVREAQQVAVRPARTLPVLHRLVRDVAYRALGVPAAHRTTQSTTPAAELLDVAGEQVQVRARAADHAERVERGPPAVVVGQRGSRGQREDRRVLARRPSRGGDGDGLRDEPLAALAGRLQHDLRVVGGQLGCGGVVRAAVGAEGEEPRDADVVGDGEPVAACRVAHLPLVGGGVLRGGAGGDGGQRIHGRPPLGAARVGARMDEGGRVVIAGIKCSTN
jgi:hypothetical protein